jgi:hypothetical protein
VNRQEEFELATPERRLIVAHGLRLERKPSSVGRRIFQIIATIGF